MNDEFPAIAAPKGIGREGRRLWKAVTKDYKLRPDELIVLENACRTVDLIAEMQEAMTGEPLVTSGSKGQEREHPLLSELRQQRTFLTRALAQLRLPDVGGVASINQHRHAAQSRWGTAHGGPA